MEPAAVVPAFSLFEPPPWQTLPVVCHGMGGARTDIVCGYLHSSHPLFSPALCALPSAFVVRPEEPAARWIQASIDYALAASTPGHEPDPGALRLPELVLVETLRLHLAGAPAIDTGWIAALSDPVLGPAMASIHAEPARDWCVDDLARTATVSRSVLDQRFRELLGQAPMRYLTGWRMHLAENLLRETDRPVASIAHYVGYDSEEAFSRAFKRDHGASPGSWRRGQRLRSVAG
jgi:AraC-like DNA-binding protein